MAIEHKSVKMCKCERCNYTWSPNSKKELPIRCAKCGSPYWNKKRER